MAGLGVKARPAPNDARAHAMCLLRQRGIRVQRIVTVEPYAIAFVRQDGSLATAWLTYSAEKHQCLVSTENGLPAFPG